MPYQRYAHYLSLLVVLLLVYLFLEAEPAGWIVQLTGVLATLLCAAFLLDAYFLWREYQRGEVFFIRNLTFFTSIFTVLTFGIMLALGWGNVIWYFLYPVLLFQTINNLFRIRIDNVSMTAKTGFGQQQEIPLFQLDRVVVSEDFIEAKLVDGQQIGLTRSMFFPKQWQRLSRRMQELEKD